MAYRTSRTKVSLLRAGDLISHPEANQNRPHWTVQAVDCFGLLAIVAFIDGTSTAPTPADAEITVRRPSGLRSAGRSS